MTTWIKLKFSNFSQPAKSSQARSATFYPSAPAVGVAPHPIVLAG